MTPSKPDFNRLIPELKKWNNGDGISIEAWLQCIGNHEHAVAYSTLSGPNLLFTRNVSSLLDLVQILLTFGWSTLEVINARLKLS